MVVENIVKTRKYYKVLTFLFVSFFVFFVSINEYIFAYEITDPSTFLYEDGRNYHWNTLTQLANGTFLFFTQNLTTHQGGSSATDCVSVYKSYDNGATWDYRGNFFTGTYPTGTNVGIMPNGSIMGMVQQPNGLYADGGMCVTFSYDDGETWSDLEWFAGITNNAFMPYCQPKYDEDSGNVFLFLTNRTTEDRLVYNSTDNGQTWTLRSRIATNLGGFYLYGLRMANGNWTCVFVDSESFPSNKAYQSFSDDDCFTWSTPSYIGLRLRNPQLMLGDPETNENPYILHAANYISTPTIRAFTIWNSSDGLSWGNAIEIDADSEKSYSTGINNVNNDDCFIMYSHEYGSGNLAYCNNVTLVGLGDPPYDFLPLRDDPEDDVISIHSINGLVNNSVTQYQNRSFNWTRVDDAVFYQLQISNSSDFSDLYLNITIEEGDYTVHGDYIEYILPFEYNITWYGFTYAKVVEYR